MPFLHLVNCLLLTYAPFFVIYKACQLSEYRALNNCIQAGIFYILTLIFKMILAAAIVPDVEDTTTQEIWRCILNVLDVVGIYITLNQRSGSDSMSKILGVAIGWSFSEALFGEFLTIIVNASGGEFTWKYIQSAVFCNLSIFCTIAFTANVWMYSKRNAKLLYILMCILNIMHPALIQIITADPVKSIGIKVGYTIAYSLITYPLFLSQEAI